MQANTQRLRALLLAAAGEIERVNGAVLQVASDGADQIVRLRQQLASAHREAHHAQYQALLATALNAPAACCWPVREA
jgi:hypothetical protein